MGDVIISLDFELGWGVLQEGLWLARERKGVYERLRYDFQTILDYSSIWEIPMTIGCVGAMLQDRESWSLEHLPLDYRTSIERFADRARRTTVHGRDLLEMISDCPARHEIASHTYTHLHKNHVSASVEVLKEEILRADSVLRHLGGNGESLIFPRDQVFENESLVGSGTMSARVPPITVGRGRMDRLFYVPPAENKMADWGGMELSGSMFLNWSTGWKSTFKRFVVKKKVAKCLSSGVDGDYHFWIHPFNLSEVPGFSKYFIDFMGRLASLRDSGDINIVTMKEKMTAEDLS